MLTLGLYMASENNFESIRKRNRSVNFCSPDEKVCMWHPRRRVKRGCDLAKGEGDCKKERSHTCLLPAFSALHMFFSASFITDILTILAVGLAKQNRRVNLQIRNRRKLRRLRNAHECNRWARELTQNEPARPLDHILWMI